MFCKRNAILIFAFFGIAKSEIGVSVCPSVTVVEDFNLTNYLGIWYEYSKYPVSFEAGRKCISGQLSENDDGTIKVVNSGQRSNGKYTSTEGKAYFSGPTNEAKLKIKFPLAPVAGDYWVLGTDYVQYSVVYSCRSGSGESIIQHAWILSRDRQPDDATIKNATAVFEKNSISTSYLVVTDQSNCQ